MQFAHTDIKPVNWTQPSTVKSLPAFVVTTHVGVGSVEPSPSTDIYPGWYVPKSGTGTNEAIDKVSGLLATTCTPDSAKSTTDNSNTNIFSVDWFINGAINKKVSGASIAATDNVHLCGEAKPQISPPSAPSSGCVNGTSCDFIITVTAGVHPFNDPQYSGNPGTVNLITGGTVVASKTISDSDCTNNDSTVANAVCTVTVKYTPSSAGDVIYSASVLDSVLYSTTSDTSTVTTTAVTTPIVIINPIAGSTTGSPVTVSWTGGCGKYTVSLDTVDVNGCTLMTAQTCPNVTITGGTHVFSVIDNNGDPAVTVTFKK